MDATKLLKIIEEHALWLKNEGDSKADLSGADLSKANLRWANLSKADLSGADLSKADLRWANLSGADLSGADLSKADLRWANLSGADLSKANLRWANLSKADLSGADLRWANLRWANLSGADLRWANLRWANLSGAKGLIQTINFMEAFFERTAEGYIAYKTFNSQYAAPEKWKIKAGSVIEENVLFDRACDCGSGVNVAPLNWVREYYGNRGHDIWKVLIRWEWLCGVCAPYGSDGKIRCERVELIEVVK